MEYAYIYILPIIGGLVLFLIINLAVRAPGKSLAKRFASLGDMSGKTYAEIKSVVGTENSVSRTVTEDGQPVTIRQWMATGYHIVLLFDSEDNFICISNETAV